MYPVYNWLMQISSDKIGTSIYYWSFPSDAKRTREAKIEELNKELDSLRQRKVELKNLIEKESSVRQDSVICSCFWTNVG
jgi:hypothetical protein